MTNTTLTNTIEDSVAPVIDADELTNSTGQSRLIYTHCSCGNELVMCKRCNVVVCIQDTIQCSGCSKEICITCEHAEGECYTCYGNAMCEIEEANKAKEEVEKFFNRLFEPDMCEEYEDSEPYEPRPRDDLFEEDAISEMIYEVDDCTRF
jgi:hypothetical protein